MLPKTPKSGFWKFVKGSAKTLFVIEAVCFAASYGVYYRMNTNRGKQYIYVIKMKIIKCCEIRYKQYKIIDIGIIIYKFKRPFLGMLVYIYIYKYLHIAYHNVIHKLTNCLR